MTRMTLAERREKLIAAALHVIGREGVAAATTRAIAAEAGMPLASFHYAFESHQVLMTEALRVLVSEELSRDHEPLSGGTRREVVASALMAHREDVETRPDRHLTILELADHVTRAVGERDLSRTLHEGRVDALAARLAQYADGREVDLGGDAAELAEVVVALQDGMTQGFLATGSVDEARRVVENLALLA